MSELNLAFLQSELNKDIKINPLKLSEELISNSYLYSKWARYMSEIKELMIKADVERKRINAERLNYYTGRSNTDICDFVYQNISELRIILAADPYVLKAETKYNIYDNMITFVIKAMDAIKGRGFDIKAAMEQRQFEQGK